MENIFNIKLTPIDTATIYGLEIGLGDSSNLMETFVRSHEVIKILSPDWLTYFGIITFIIRGTTPRVLSILFCTITFQEIIKVQKKYTLSETEFHKKDKRDVIFFQETKHKF